MLEQTCQKLNACSTRSSNHGFKYTRCKQCGIFDTPCVENYRRDVEVCVRRTCPASWSFHASIDSPSGATNIFLLLVTPTTLMDALRMSSSLRAYNNNTQHHMSNKISIKCPTLVVFCCMRAFGMGKTCPKLQHTMHAKDAAAFHESWMHEELQLHCKKIACRNDPSVYHTCLDTWPINAEPIRPGPNRPTATCIAMVTWNSNPEQLAFLQFRGDVESP